MQVANRVIDKIMEPISKLVDHMFDKLGIPDLGINFNFNVPVLNLLKTWIDKIREGLTKTPTIQVERNGLCVNASI